MQELAVHDQRRRQALAGRPVHLPGSDRGRLLPGCLPKSLHIHPNWFLGVVRQAVRVADVEVVQGEAQDDQAVPDLPQRLRLVEEVDAHRPSVDGDCDARCALRVLEVPPEFLDDCGMLHEDVAHVLLGRKRLRRQVLGHDEPPDLDLPVLASGDAAAALEQAAHGRRGVGTRPEVPRRRIPPPALHAEHRQGDLASSIDQDGCQHDAVLFRPHQLLAFQEKHGAVARVLDHHFSHLRLRQLSHDTDPRLLCLVGKDVIEGSVGDEGTLGVQRERFKHAAPCRRANAKFREGSSRSLFSSWGLMGFGYNLTVDVYDDGLVPQLHRACAEADLPVQAMAEASFLRLADGVFHRLDRSVRQFPRRHLLVFRLCLDMDDDLDEHHVLPAHGIHPKQPCRSLSSSVSSA